MSKAIDKKESTYSKSLMKEIPIINKLFSIVALTSVSLGDSKPDHIPNLPLDVITEILCRLPVNVLLQFRCVCKLWNSLISDHKFAKKHLSLSTMRHLHFLNYCTDLQNYLLTSYPLHSIFTNTTTNSTKLECPPINYNSNFNMVGSCNGILCLADYNNGFVILWNPSIRKLKELPFFQKPRTLPHDGLTYGFGYDSVTDKYKVVVFLHYHIRDSSDNFIYKIEVKIHILGTSFWKTNQDFPFDDYTIEGSGYFLDGAISWLASKDPGTTNSCFIVSFNLENESFQKILLPDYEHIDACDLELGVLKDCLCIITGDDVWVMKEYGNKESWTKLFKVCHMQYPRTSYSFTKIINIFDDDQVLLEYIEDTTEVGWMWKSVVYNFKNDTFNFTEFEITPEICVESLISPCF